MGRLLVVDDDRETLESLKDVLEAHGHTVLTAESGEAALDELSRNQFDLALVDLKLGTISGFDVIRAIEREHPETVVIVFTGYASLESAMEALRMGAYDFLQKPLKMEILIKALDRGLEKRHLKDLAEELTKKMEEGLALIDSEGLIRFANERFPEMVNYSIEELKGRSFLSLVSPENEGAVRAHLSLTRQENSQKLQATLIRMNGMELVGIVSLTSIGDGVLVVISDITKIAGPPVIGGEITYRIEPGFIYLAGEENPHRAMEAFLELVKTGYKGTIITREHPEEIKRRCSNDVQVLRLTEEIAGELTLFPNITIIERKIEPCLSENRVVLIERLDYLISHVSFEAVLNKLQRFRDLVSMRKSIVILSVDRRTLTEREFSLLEKETVPLLPISKPEIREDLTELLNYVAKRNEIGIRPNHKEIEKRFNVTRSTVRERLKILSSKGLVVEGKRGRTRVIEITERGRKLIS